MQLSRASSSEIKAQEIVQHLCTHDREIDIKFFPGIIELDVPQTILVHWARQQAQISDAIDSLLVVQEFSVHFHAILVDENAAVVLIAVERMKWKLDRRFPDMVLVPSKVVGPIAIPSSEPFMRAADCNTLAVESTELYL